MNANATFGFSSIARLPSSWGTSATASTVGVGSSMRNSAYVRWSMETTDAETFVSSSVESLFARDWAYPS